MPAASGIEVDILRRQVHELKSLVNEQQSVLAQQQAAIEQLRESLDQKPATISVQAPPEIKSWAPPVRPFDAQRYASYGDRRLYGLYDARFHSTRSGAIPRDYRVLPERIILVRHAQSEGNVDNMAYTYIPDPQVPLTETGRAQAKAAGQKIKRSVEAAIGSSDYRLFFYTSPYKRSLQTYEGICQAFSSQQVKGVQEEVQLREQDFGNFQDQDGIKREKAERLRFGRFFYRFPNGESGADVYDRITIFEDHMIRDINAGRFSNNTSLVLVTHGLALRIFLMRWFHWTVDQFLNVFNPGNAEPLVLERVDPDEAGLNPSEASWMHTKALYRLSEESRALLKGCSEEMASTSCLGPSVHEADMARARARAHMDMVANKAWEDMGGGW